MTSTDPAQLIEQSAQVAGLLSGLRVGRVAHAYLLTGPQGSGKGRLMERCAQILLCASPDERPCGVCPPCCWHKAGTHPDDIVMSEERMGVDEARALIASIARKPFADGRRVVRIHRADGMTPQAQNALLKTLEEPPGDTVFLLAARGEKDLLPTVRSRCRPLRMPRLPDQAILSMLEAAGIPRGLALGAAAQAGGYPFLALQIAESGESAAFAWAQAFLAGDAAARVRLAQEAEGHKDEAEAYLSALEAALGLALHSRGGGDLGRIARIIEASARARAQMNVFVSWPSVLHGLLIESDAQRTVIWEDI